VPKGVNIARRSGVKITRRLTGRALMKEVLTLVRLQHDGEIAVKESAIFFGANNPSSAYRAGPIAAPRYCCRSV
jgi:hypothetical protein